MLPSVDGRGSIPIVPIGFNVGRGVDVDVGVMVLVGVGVAALVLVGVAVGTAVLVATVMASNTTAKLQSVEAMDCQTREPESAGFVNQLRFTVRDTLAISFEAGSTINRVGSITSNVQAPPS